MVSWSHRLRVGLIAGLLGLVQNASAQTEISATNLLGEHAITDPLPIQVELRHAGAPLRGRLEWQNNPNLRYSLPLELAQGARKVAYLAIALNAWGQEEEWRKARPGTPKLLWRTESGKAQKLDVPYRWTNRLPVAVIGTPQGGFEQWRKAQFSLKYSFDHQKVQSGDWSLEPVYWLPRIVPTSYEPLLGIPVIILTEGSEFLATEQWDALFGWLLAGGHLIVSVGSIGTSLQGTPLAPLLPPMGERTILTVPTSSKREEAPLRIPIIRSSGWSDAVAQVWEGQTLVACSRRVGCGTLTLCFADMQTSVWRSWQGYAQLINQWCASIDIPLQNLRKPPSERSLRLRIERKRVAWLAGVFALFWVGLYLSWYLLRRRRRLIYAPLALLGLTGSTLGLITQIMPNLHHQKRSEVKRTLLADRHLPIALEHSHQHLLLPAGAYRLQGEMTYSLLALDRSGISLLRATLEYGAYPNLSLQAISSLEVQLQTVHLLRLPMPVSVLQSGPRYTVLNPFDIPMEAVQIVHSKNKGTTFQSIASIVAPKASVSGEPTTVPDKGLSPPQEGEWLTAVLRGLRKPLKTPSEGQEEPVRLWLRIR